MFFKIYLTLHINVQSSQIWSAWEWCHWIGKSTRAIGFYFFTSHSWIYLVYKVLSSFIKSNLLQVRFACAQTYHDWCTLVKRFCQSTALFTVCKMMEFFLTRSCNSKSNLRLSRIFVVRFRGEKKCEHMQTVIRTCRRLDFMKLLRTLYILHKSVGGGRG